MLRQTRRQDLALFIHMAHIEIAEDAGRHAAARADSGVRDQRIEDGVHHGLLHLLAVLAGGSGGVERADVDGHGDDAAGGGIGAVQDIAVRARGRLAFDCARRWGRVLVEVRCHSSAVAEVARLPAGGRFRNGSLATSATWDQDCDCREILMTIGFVLELARDFLMTALLISLPALVVSLIIGLIVGVLQTVTSVQEQTLSFVPRFSRSDW